jgi:uncharacterized membrane protein YfcA
MPADFPVSELIALAAALAATGLVVGFMAGIFGIGGGAIMVPILYQALGLLGFPDEVNIKVALGTSLAVIVPTSIRSFRAHHARGAVDMAIIRSWLVPVPLGVILGAIVAAVASGEALRGVFAALAGLVGVRLIFNRESWRIGRDLPGGALRWMVGGVVGFFSALMGIGGGILTNTFMTLYGRPIHQSVATASGVGVLIAIPGTIGFMVGGFGDPDLPAFSIGYVNLLGMAIVMPLSLVAAPLGVRSAHALSKRQLESGFGLFLLLVSARFTYSLL